MEPEKPSHEIVKLVFGRAIQEPTADWLDDPGSIVWFLPFSGLDAVLGVLRDGDPPIRLQASRRDGGFAASLSTKSKTRVASDDV